MLQILGRSSSINVRKVLWLCDELQLAFEREDWGAGFASPQTPSFLALNPNALIPVIRDGDFTLWESHAIIRYLAGAYGGETLYPADVRARAKVDQWIDWSASELNPAWVYAFMGLVKGSAVHTDETLIEASVANWTRKMRILEGQLTATGGYVAGAAFSLADIPVGLSVHRWYSTPIDHGNLPAVAAYYETLTGRSGFKLYGRNGMP